jgi:UDP-galactopyranose mutase
MTRTLIVGAGLYGAVCARELADAGHTVQVIEQRHHLGGNCHTRFDEVSGCHEHVHGAHIFHTNDPALWTYVHRFAVFLPYVHRVQARHGQRLLSLPINLRTLREVFGAETEEAARQAIAQDREAHQPAAAEPLLRNVESHCLATIGPTLYRLLIEGYTRKQWNRAPAELPASIVQRLPVRFDEDDRYFSDRFQGIPAGGYTALFERLLQGVPVALGVDFLADRDHWLARYDRVIYTGALDAFFDHCHGPLEYRSLRFERAHVPVDDFQGRAVVNYTEAAVPWTRIIEHRHFEQPQRPTGCTLITREHPLDWQPGLPAYYPVNTPANQARLERYRTLAELPEVASQVHFGGRLAQYRYYDMHQVIAAALSCVRRMTQSPAVRQVA